MSQNPANEDGDIRKTVADMAYDAIAERIASAEYGALERITEARIVEEFGVSRGAAREALSRLAADGLVVLEIYKGAVVRAISRKDMADFLDVRGLFEAYAAQRSAGRINEEGARERVHEVLEHCRQLEEAPTSDGMVENDTLYHSTIMDLSGNSILPAEWRRLRRSRYRIRFIESLNRDEILETTAQTRDILHAILDGDTELAAELATRHIRLVNSRIQRMPTEQFDAIFNPPARKKGRAGKKDGEGEGAPAKARRPRTKVA
ncbi:MULTISPECIES: GntR family transcriptional regulator [Sphingobium]|uniref:HTH gntR-type domain-containing protein n=1 Tax=Sphingobium chungbukense TaxID=56193 RepID=A0A0M3AQB0_9SPHN|nr:MULTISPECIES: GntR family transcriptional regulator [Sphingobium]KKW92025.1 hypothetical protein YP76_13205 [Sphingobium chungbukense]PJG46228.1 GntR family transcriptional regulator [Sphingobium sp. LB126]